MNVWEMYQQTLNHTKTPNQAAKRVMDVLDSDRFDQLNELAEETTYRRRKYYPCQFYCWPQHEKLLPMDPWPASRFPKAVLCMEFARALNL